MSSPTVSPEEQRLIAEIQRKHGKTVGQLRDEREKRVKAAMELNVPDQVPVNVSTGVFAAKYAGLTASVMYYDHAAYRRASKQMLLDFEPDNGPIGIGSSGLVLDLLDSKQYRWPGGNLPADGTYQFVEGEYMKADEYERFLSNPCDFVIRSYLPRTYGALAPLAELPPLTAPADANEVAAILGMLFRPDFNALITILEQLNRPELKETMVLLRRVQQEQQRLGQESAQFGAEMGRLGFPSGGGDAGGSGATFAPFDTISRPSPGHAGSHARHVPLPGGTPVRLYPPPGVGNERGRPCPTRSPGQSRPLGHATAPRFGWLHVTGGLREVLLAHPQEGYRDEGCPRVHGDPVL